MSRGAAARRAAWGALVVGLLNAAVSAYWALGGTAGLETLGGRLEELTRARAPSTLAALWLVVAAKVAGAALGVLLLRAGALRWRRLLRLGTWTAAVVLVTYGGALVAGQILVVSGVITASPDADWTAIYGHLLLWDPWFLLWGAPAHDHRDRHARTIHGCPSCSGARPRTSSRVTPRGCRWTWASGPA